MNIRNILLTSLFLAVSASAAKTDLDTFCSNLCCKKITTTKTGLIGRQCQPFRPGSGAPSFAPEPSCPDQPLCCQIVAPGGRLGAKCSRIYF
ncbi:unnamed protein product [Tilletia controversa]|uniref:Hydrophobin n=3 Tax=Tilletia TaxID=13289 RepID=A0A8X7SXZ9_9BASI|nr:hypothetical protein CF336_g4137 [Tilletia laevis]KAE8197362.1 hypothetical protein CF328_g3868 [Tilletia controversa]KAE8261141.1 hypothetical protein A4X03_0g3507 [Tilletia caries]KAE8202026.1 hypothetical protein CF335_g3570 [Tilletia laevis]KAE8250131.1 hypothetical protein A4X06_0g2912 [Tilletia controversa]